MSMEKDISNKSPYSDRAYGEENDYENQTQRSITDILTKEARNTLQYTQTYSQAKSHGINLSEKDVYTNKFVNELGDMSESILTELILSNDGTYQDPALPSPAEQQQIFVPGLEGINPDECQDWDIRQKKSEVDDESLLNSDKNSSANNAIESKQKPPRRSRKERMQQQSLSNKDSLHNSRQSLVSSGDVAKDQSQLQRSVLKQSQDEEVKDIARNSQGSHQSSKELDNMNDLQKSSPLNNMKDDSKDPNVNLSEADKAESLQSQINSLQQRLNSMETTHRQHEMDRQNFEMILSTLQTTLTHCAYILDQRSSQVSNQPPLNLNQKFLSSNNNQATQNVNNHKKAISNSSKFQEQKQQSQFVQEDQSKQSIDFQRAFEIVQHTHQSYSSVDFEVNMGFYMEQQHKISS